MSMNKMLNQARHEVALLTKQNNELKNQIEQLSRRPEFNLSTVHGREQAIAKLFNNQIKPDTMVVNDE
jgi:Tfp pilus assembly protein PilN